MTKLHYFVIPLITIIVALLASSFTRGGMEWYNSWLLLPSLVPPGVVTGMVWALVYILATVSAILVWSFKTSDLQMGLEVKLMRHKKNAIIGFIANAILNVSWSFAFFTLHLIGPAIIISAVLGLSVLYIIRNAWPVSRSGSIILLPYLFWIGFATYINFVIFTTNPHIPLF